jgi:small subunit ribosomal protein S2
MFYINQRWLGGLLTNYVTIQKSIQRLKELETMSQDGRYEMLTKKEVGKLERERKHLEQNLAGIKSMPGLPDAIFVIDSNNEGIAVREARKLAIPGVAVVDTNCDPEQVNYPIPGNDDALRAIRLFTSKIAEAVIEGNALAAAAAAGPQGAEGEAVEAGPDEAGTYAGGGASSDYDPNGGPAAMDSEGAPGVTRFHA